MIYETINVDQPESKFFECQNCKKEQKVKKRTPKDANTIAYVCKYCGHCNYKDNVAPFDLYYKIIIIDGKERKFVKEVVDLWNNPRLNLKI